MTRVRVGALLVGVIIGCGGGEGPVEVEPDVRWSVGVPLPIGLTEAAAAVFDGSIYVAGGESDAGPSRHVYRFTPGTNAWLRLADLPDFRVRGRLVVSGGDLYLVGGMNRPASGYYPDRRLFRYRPAEDRWVQLASFPDIREGDAVGVPGGIVVVGGGFGDPEHGGVYPGDSVVVYNTATDTWRYAAPIRTPRYHPMAVANGPVVHVFGGLALDRTGTPRQVEIYDAASNSWRLGGLFVDYGRIVGQAHARVGIHVHFFGGLNPVPGSPVIETHFRYDMATDRLDVLPEMPTPRARAAAVALDGRIYVIGGMRGLRGLPGSYVDLVEVYDAR